ncbi:MAG: dipeptide epimerase [Spirochaetaceae bacterium]|nr:MAG: dipeptide epimerase [Spirochaetaceae bacterium]
MTVQVRQESFPLAQVFTISRGSRTEARVLTVEIRSEGFTGRSECVPYPRYGESTESVTRQIETMAAELTRSEPAMNRAVLTERMPAGAARNALDCALWDLEGKLSGRPVWDLAGLTAPAPVLTAYTLSLDEPPKMRSEAAKHAHRPLLKIKLGGWNDVERLKAVREGAPNCDIIVDANEGWTTAVYRELCPTLQSLGVKMVEQPFPAGHDQELADLPRPVPICADESCHTRAHLAGLIGRYDYINIKLDKTGGLTEALALRAEALQAGLGIMVGCMMGSSLGMAPAVIAAQGATFVDLDGPLWLAKDRPHGLKYDEVGVHPPTAELWG